MNPFSHISQRTARELLSSEVHKLLHDDDKGTENPGELRDDLSDKTGLRDLFGWS